uniref:Uncharacterized protein n=1 Tax=Jaculus jaculus TaxID=51337 RepID=A0A8C5JZY0_JACJA
MKQGLLSVFTIFLFAAFLFLGLCRTLSINHSATQLSSDLKDAQRTNGAHFLHHYVKCYLPPCTPPFVEPEPNFKGFNCMKTSFMETQVGYCSTKKVACCLSGY